MMITKRKYPFKERFALVILCTLFYSYSFAQSFKEIKFQCDTGVFYSTKNSAMYLGEKNLFVKIENPQQIFELTLYPDESNKISFVKLLPSSNLIVIDSIINIGDNYFRGRVKFKNIEQTRLVLAISSNSGQHVEEIKLFPYYETKIAPTKEPVDLYAGEEKTFEIPALNPGNIFASPDLIKKNDYDYSLSTDSKNLLIQIHPNVAGNMELALNLKTIHPFLNAKHQLSYDLDSLIVHLNVKPSRLNFINMDKADFFLDNATDETEEVQLDQKKGFDIGKVYRIENQIEPGGKLVAELFIKSFIGDNKVLCGIRPYSYHKISEGYLYLKQSNDAKYITNFNILQKPTIQSISLLRDGEDWTTSSIVHPGENIQIKIEGKGLAKAKFQFSNCDNVKQDSSRIFDDIVFYSFHVPSFINKKVIYVEMNKKTTKYEITIKENQRPRDFDFVFVNYDGLLDIPFTSELLNKPVVEPHSLNEINISFNFSLIDGKELLYGKQYLDFEFKLYNAKNDLIEDQKLENISICPNESSPRGSFYDTKDCFKSIININDYLLHKTYDLEGWSKVEITVKHSSGKYSESGYSRRVIIIKQKLTTLDLQASFPAGLLVKQFNTKGIGELSGLSIAFLAQMSFYEKDGIAKLKPYKIGTGIIAFNIFNLTATNAQPDIGAVAIASILPLKTTSKFNFPLYFGFGYMLKSGNWFTLLGPGVQFNF